jgi:hypothetical protein
MHTAYILKAAGEKKEAKHLFTESAEAGFELGPVAVGKIKKQLAGL